VGGEEGRGGEREGGGVEGRRRREEWRGGKADGGEG